MDAGHESFPISVNVSPLQFSKENFADTIIALQKKYDVPSHLVELEVLESTVTDAVASVVNSINALRAYGFKISVDDFGSGYSCLNQIASIPADIIKLDLVFASHGLKTEMERNLAYSFGCDVIQGYFYSKPLPVNEFEVNYLK